MKIAILGMGTVGSGVLKVLQENREHIEKITQQTIEVTHIFSETIKNLHNSDLTNIIITENLEDILNSGVDLVVETLGGIDFTFKVHQKFLSHGVHVVSANKDMLALHINELAKIGNKHQAQLAYEASCVGGVPIINALTYGLQANKLSRLMGILNGTTNYILDKMTNHGMSYEKALEEAQEKGYAESDPTNDVEGFDAQRKITLLSRLAYHRDINIADVPVKGISSVELVDIEKAKKAGFVLKLLGVSEYDGKKLSMSVGPILLPGNHQLSFVADAANGVFVNGNAIGEAMFSGPGAGSLETASAIAADVMFIAQFGFTGNLVVDEPIQLEKETGSKPYYVRFAELNEQVKQVLNSLAIEYRNINEDSEAVIIEAMNKHTLQDLQQNSEVKAFYPIIQD